MPPSCRCFLQTQESPWGVGIRPTARYDNNIIGGYQYNTCDVIMGTTDVNAITLAMTLRYRSAREEILCNIKVMWAGFFAAIAAAAATQQTQAFKFSLKLTDTAIYTD